LTNTTLPEYLLQKDFEEDLIAIFLTGSWMAASPQPGSHKDRKETTLRDQVTSDDTRAHMASSTRANRDQMAREMEL
jgi:hypothetical protein